MAQGGSPAFDSQQVSAFHSLVIPTVRFLAVCKNGGGKPGRKSHMLHDVR